MIIVVFGLPGSGKSYFAKNLAERLNAKHIKSDEVRAEMEKMGTYDRQSKEAVYQEMVTKMTKLCEPGQILILDATFYKKHLRAMVQKQAAYLNASLYFIRVIANEDVIYQRVSKERPDSEADFQAYLKVKEAFEPLDAPHLQLDSSAGDLAPMLEKAESYLGVQK